MIAESGLDVTGWKIRATVEALFSCLGVTRLFLGPLFIRYTHSNEAHVKVLPGTKLENEITVRLKSDLPAKIRPTPTPKLKPQFNISIRRLRLLVFGLKVYCRALEFGPFPMVA